MARYLEVAAEANKQLKSIVDFATSSSLRTMPDGMVKAELAQMLAHLYNLGIRTNPRPAQSTVRLRAVQTACKGQESLWKRDLRTMGKEPTTLFRLIPSGRMIFKRERKQESSHG